MRSEPHGHQGGVVRSDWTEYESPSRGIVETIAAVTDRPVESLVPLAESVDPEAVDDLLTGGDGETTASFVHDGVRVTAAGDGRVEVDPDREGAGPPRNRADLAARLASPFDAARREGVRVRGGLRVRTPPDQDDLDVHVTRLRPER
jgi:hypothetical protein